MIRVKVFDFIFVLSVVGCIGIIIKLVCEIVWFMSWDVIFFRLIMMIFLFLLVVWMVGIILECLILLWSVIFFGRLCDVYCVRDLLGL